MQKLFLALLAACGLSCSHASGFEEEVWLSDRISVYALLDEKKEVNYFPWLAERVSSGESIVSTSCGLHSLKFTALEKINQEARSDCQSECQEIYSLLDEQCRPLVDFNQKYSILVTRKYGGRDYLLSSFLVQLDAENEFYVSAKQLMKYFPEKKVKNIPRDKQECIELEYLSRSRLEVIADRYFVEINDESLCFNKGVYLF